MLITFGNFKGGVGKTTATTLFTYLLSKQYKVLAIDTDPQANLTESLSRTYNYKFDKEKNIFNGLFSDEPITTQIQSVNDNLDVLAGTWDMVNFEQSMDMYYKKDHKNILKLTIEPIRDNYDFVLIDTAPATNLVMDNVITATDYVVITTKTELLSYDSTQKFYTYLLDRYNSSEYNFELLGVLPYLVGTSATDKKMLEKYADVFDVESFENKIKQSDRVKSWSMYGVTEDKPYDRRTLDMYQKVVEEAVQRINNFH